MRMKPEQRLIRFNRSRALVLALVVAVAGAAGVATALASNDHVQSRAATAGVNPSVSAQLSVFNRTPTAADSLPVTFSGQLQGQAGSSPDFGDARRVIADDGQAAYLVPAQGGVCVTNANEAFCSSAAALGGAAAVDLCSPDLPLGRLELEWLLPDGASNVALGMSDGSTKPFDPGYNVYIARLPLTTTSPVPTTIQWTDAAGQRQSVSTPIPAGVQGQACMHPDQVTPGSGSSGPAAQQTESGPPTPIG